jgi:beta-lactamase regulating signal transducer with metallopeptidase domain
MLPLVLTNTLLATALAGGVYLIGRWLRHPALVHALWLLVLLKFITPPVVDWPLRLPGFLCRESGDSVPVTSESLAWAQPSYLGRAATVVEIPVAVEVTDAEAASRVDLQGAYRTVFSWLPMIWAIGCLTCVLIYWRRRSQLRRLLRLARPAPESWQKHAEALAARLRLRRCPTVCTVPGRVPPMVIFGFGGPRIVLPSELVGSLGTDRRAALLLHELAHLSRGDHWGRRLEMVVRILYWWYPPIAWIGRQLRVVEEQCCDSLVVTTLPEGRREYAALLLDTLDFVGATLSSRAYREALAMSSFCTLKRRVTMVLRESFSSRLSPRMFLMVAGLALLVLPFGLTFAAAGEGVAERILPPVKPTGKEKADVVHTKHPVASGRAAPAAVQYTVRLRVVLAGAEEQERVMARPTLVTIEGQPASLWVGARIPPPEATQGTEEIFTGVKICQTISRRNGKVYLDGTYRNTVLHEAPDEGLQLETTESRLIRPIQLGKKLTVLLPGVDDRGAQTRVEIVVQESDSANETTPLPKRTE